MHIRLAPSAYLKQKEAAKAAFKVDGSANTNASAMKKKHIPNGDGITNPIKIYTMPLSPNVCYSYKRRICTICDTWNKNIKRAKDLQCRKCRGRFQLDDSDESGDSEDDA